MELAAAKVFRAKWSDDIHAEWMRNLLKDRPDLKIEQLERTRELMNEAVGDCLVYGYEDLVPALDLPDANDRHVLATAIVSSADAIITFNLKDFPRSVLEKYQIEAIHPDDFIKYQFDLLQSAVVIAAQRCRGRLRNPPKTAIEYLETLELQRLPQTVDLLSQYSSVL